MQGEVIYHLQEFHFHTNMTHMINKADSSLWMVWCNRTKKRYTCVCALCVRKLKSNKIESHAFRQPYCAPKMNSVTFILRRSVGIIIAVKGRAGRTRQPLEICATRELMAMTWANLNDIEREIPAPYANRNVYFWYSALQHDVDFRAFSKRTAHTHRVVLCVI